MALALCLFISLLSIPFSTLFLSLSRILLRSLTPQHTAAHLAWLGVGATATAGDDDLSPGDATTSLNQLLHHLLHPRRHDVSINLSVARYERPSDEAAADADDVAENCAVCLCGIEEGEEIRELRCRHVFHRRCLDRWLASRRPTCPLCRDALVPPHEPAANKGGGFVAADVFDEEELGDSAAAMLQAYVQWLMW